MTYTLITIGLFVAFFLAVILPIRRLAKRKGLKQEQYTTPKKWSDDPSHPLWQENFRRLPSKEW
jgi:hypothetical protein